MSMSSIFYDQLPDEFTAAEAAEITGRTISTMAKYMSQWCDGGRLVRAGVRKGASKTKHYYLFRKKNPPRDEIYAWLDEVPSPQGWPVTTTDLGARWGCAWETARGRIDILVSMGFVEARALGKLRLYRQAVGGVRS